MKYWSVEDGAIVGHATGRIPRNELLWSRVGVGDFYLAVDVKMETNDLNAGRPFTVRYKIAKLVHDPEVKLAGLDEATLNDKLRPAYPGK